MLPSVGGAATVPGGLPATQPAAAISPAPGARPSGPPWRTILTVAWLSILLGFAIEGLLLAVSAGSGGLANPRPFVADLVQKVSFSLVVCVGISFGTAAAKMRPVAMGALGLIAAPSAFAVAKALQKTVSGALGLAASVGGPSSIALAAIKAVQYGLFGIAAGKLGSRRAGLGAHALLGLGAGALFGGLVLLLTARSRALAPAALLGRGINEVVFPIGCAVVLYVAEALKPKA